MREHAAGMAIKPQVEWSSPSGSFPYDEQQTSAAIAVIADMENQPWTVFSVAMSAIADRSGHACGLSCRLNGKQVAVLVPLPCSPSST